MKGVLGLTLLLFVFGVSGGYVLEQNWAGANFFNGWQFWTGDDPTHGTVDYVSQQVAQQAGLINTNVNGRVYIGADMTHTVSTKQRGRQSVRITTQQTYNSGLFIIDLAHMPTGCGTWPAWWLVGPNWPTGGEIDIIEGINLFTAVQTTLHTNDGCSMAGEDKNSFTGTWVPGTNGQPATNCNVKAPNQANNQGCSIKGLANSYGAPFNNNGGGVYVCEFTGNFIRMFFFPRNSIPGDIGAKVPNPNNWGKPYANFELGGQCPNSHFKNLQMVINLTFCGDWAGADFGSECPNDGTCANFVKQQPSAFKESYWSINYVDVYQNQ